MRECAGGLNFRGPGDSFVCIRERGVQGGYAMEREMLFVSLYYD